MGSKVPGGLIGRTWLHYSYHRLLPPHLEGALGFGLPIIFLCSFFPWFFVLLCLQAAVFFPIFLFFPARSFSSVGHLAYGDRARQIVSSSSYLSFIYFPL